MAIYNLFEKEESNAYRFPPFGGIHPLESKNSKSAKEKGRLLSALGARLFFFFLLVIDVLWGCLCVLRWVCFLHLHVVLCTRCRWVRNRCKMAYLSLKRSSVCALALFVALFSPALGIMFACSYFLMYDKAGIDAVVPSVLREQFREFMDM